MPVGSIGFLLRPDGFFDANPALDLPRATLKTINLATDETQMKHGSEF